MRLIALCFCVLALVMILLPAVSVDAQCNGPCCKTAKVVTAPVRVIAEHHQAKIEAKVDAKRAAEVPGTQVGVTVCGPAAVVPVTPSVTPPPAVCAPAAAQIEVKHKGPVRRLWGRIRGR